MERGNLKGEMERGATGRGDGRGQRGGGEEGARGGGIFPMDIMECLGGYVLQD